MSDDPRGPVFWRTFDERAGRPEGREFIPDPEGGPRRREFLAFLGASFALAGTAGCGKPPSEPILPYVHPPEAFLPGKPLFFATALTLHGRALGVLVESHLGRPTKVEGNPDHPASLGATDAFAQASLLSLYDPERSQAALRRGQIGTWSAFLEEAGAALEAQRARGGRGLRLLSEQTTSPTLAAEIEELRREFPEARWYAYEPAEDEAARQGLRLAFGQEVAPVYDFLRADVVVSLDADFLTGGAHPVRYARDFMARRHAPERFNRLYVLESTPTGTGAAADHRFPLRARDIAGFAAALAAQLGPAEGDGDAASNEVRAIARDLRRRAGACVLLAGPSQPPEVHALVHLLNVRLGNRGRTVNYIEAPERPFDRGPEALGRLVEEMRAGRVEVLVLLGGNPVYNAPADLDFAEALRRVPFSVRLGVYEDETSAHCLWHLPEAHPLETWGDARAFDGTATIQQPLISPLTGGRSALEVVAALRARPAPSGYDRVRAAWRARWGPDAFEERWRAALEKGVVPGTAAAPRDVRPREDFVPGVAARSGSGLEVVFRPDPSVWDGRFAANAWLQELPKPISKLTWENPAVVGPATAWRFGLSSGDVVELRRGGRAVTGPVWVQPGHPEGTVTLHLGFGRRRAGRVGTGRGFSAYVLRTSEAPWVGADLELRRTGARVAPATTQGHHLLHGRPIVRRATLEEFRRNPDFAREAAPAPGPEESLYPEFQSEPYAWGMAINLSACTGCNACVVACQAENNVPAVGPEEVRRSREMHWLRIDLYYEGSPENPRMHFQPMLCQHCEKAPCEVVCPVAATSHSGEGLNEMTYNRCIGTRYCSNNCPYKVRRFNFFQYADTRTPVLQLLWNPDVTVRSRGVMEKCTYCVQRINRARIEARKEGRRIRDGEVVTACQAACPTRAIVFGDAGDPETEVSRRKRSPLNYGVLAELNTRPRTTYLARLVNPNPELSP
ncbi:MAG TPA: 4Fe-4S dicluster domain-containing protein [Planctomycetota bacterium]|nr:4Fe-4S dicluster domain-containing protein [Planctomycetota bacterium]